MGPWRTPRTTDSTSTVVLKPNGTLRKSCETIRSAPSREAPALNTPGGNQSGNRFSSSREGSDPKTMPGSPAYRPCVWTLHPPTLLGGAVYERFRYVEGGPRNLVKTCSNSPRYRPAITTTHSSAARLRCPKTSPQGDGHAEPPPDLLGYVCVARPPERGEGPIRKIA